MTTLKTKDLKIIAHLREDSRMSLTTMSRKTNIPVSTIFDRLKANEDDLIIKHTTLINFEKLGFHTRANILIKVDRENRLNLKDYLTKHKNVNSVFRINNNFDYMFEAIFKNIKELEDFLENIDVKFNIQNKEVFYIIEDIKKESFLSEPYFIDCLLNQD